MSIVFFRPYASFSVDQACWELVPTGMVLSMRKRGRCKRVPQHPIYPKTKSPASIGVEIERETYCACANRNHYGMLSKKNFFDGYKRPPALATTSFYLDHPTCKHLQSLALASPINDLIISGT
ncbi:hypothetical protein AVEN_100640-1 [Araneus ventricosus]|uniref:Uncharacterized protein n=1 Tax=Araneus ventricosus TaxID=182803 RepID=A0A4Y2UV96_ARAVE|nr:hypothetical protein AVEN_100640-1 [Araneus ventricosus]